VDYSLLYSQEALNDLAEIVGHIAADDLEAASRLGRSPLDDVRAGVFRLRAEDDRGNIICGFMKVSSNARIEETTAE
jgi:plasmid stabilization system protein ParE